MMTIIPEKLDEATRRAVDHVLELPSSASCADGVIETLPAVTAHTFSQRALDTAATAWFYEICRERLLRVAGQPDFAAEAKSIAARLRPQPGDIVLDLACGHGNFTLEWARRVGPDGLVIGLDYSRSMLARAARHAREEGVRNVVLVHGDAHDLPVRAASVDRVNCSGGFHAFPDLPTVVRELARTTRPGARLTASTFAATSDDAFGAPKRLADRLFALHFVELDTLADDLAAAGFTDYEWSRPRAGFGYLSAVRGSAATP